MTTVDASKPTIYLPVDAPLDAAKNPNWMAPEKLAQLVATIRTYGYEQPGVVRPLWLPGEDHSTWKAYVENAEHDDEHQATHEFFNLGFRHGVSTGSLAPPTPFEIVDGHHRRAAAKQAGATILPWILDTAITEAQARALRVSMNRLRGELDLAAVGAEFRELEAAGWTSAQLSDLGFTIAEVDALVDAGRGMLGGANAGEKPDGFVPPPEPGQDPTSWVLELEFDDKKSMQRAKRRLRRIAGKGGSMAQALLKVLAEDDQ